MEISIKKCPNCGGDSFTSIGDDKLKVGVAVIFGSSENAAGELEMDESKQLPVVPVVCLKCRYVHLFSLK